MEFMVNKPIIMTETWFQLSEIIEEQDLQPIRKLTNAVAELLKKFDDNISELQLKALDSMNNIEATSCKENLLKYSKIFNVLALTENKNINGCQFLLFDAMNNDINKFAQIMEDNCHITLNDYQSCKDQHVTLTDFSYVKVTLTGEYDTGFNHTV